MPDSQKKLTIAQLPADERPREKLEQMGPESLTKAELLAILIGSGTPGESVVELTQRMLAQVNGSLIELGKLSLTELMKFKGIGHAKAVTIKAACELGTRRSMEKAVQRQKFDSAKAVAEYLRHQMRDLPHEESRILILDNALRLKANVLVSQGAADWTMIDIRTVLYELIQHRAIRFILAHNHPSGSNKPSKQDDDITKRLKAAAEAIQIPLVDHIIIAEDTYYSYVEEGRL
ncbi:MAG: DNA repair protein RadC [Bacteroidaceae bacterium]|nr:DNA repair protein RadC [Bacteroidaceae bacterium]